MNRFAKILTADALSGLALATAGAATAQGRWDWSPSERANRLAGAGVGILYPELRTSPRGRAFVMRNFDFDRNGWISPREARAANRAFAEVAGARRDRFDWDRPGHDVVVEEARGGWDHRAMRDYGFRQTARGATLNLQEDVLFKTDSDALRPGAIDKLRPLAGYLKSERGVRVAIDGYTDSRGSDAHNQALSERRAASVRSALDAMGVVRARFVVQGHGETNPVATNATPEGMRQNRRVEVTLLGQRADRFSRDD